MHAYLISGQNPKTKIDTILDSTWTKLNYSLETIEQIRELISFVQLSVPTNTAIIINDLDQATLESQNTLLKAIEEPQDNLKFVILTPSEDAIIETIRSRCQIIYAGEKDERTIDRELENFFDLNVGQKFNITTKIKKREEAIEFLQNIIKANHKNINAKNQELENALSALNAIQKNGNVNLQLTNFVINSH